MNKIIKNIINIFLKMVCVVLFLILSLYIGLWVYVTMSVPDDLKQQYEQSVVFDFSEEQYQIIWFTLTENKDYRFKWYPFIIEFFLRDKKDEVDSIAATILMFSDQKYIRSTSTLPTLHIEYGLTRYIRKNNNYKKCLSIITSVSYMGNGINGIENASEYYYNKRFSEMTEKEWVSLVLLIVSPGRYEIGSIYSENKTNEIINKYNN